MASERRADGTFAKGNQIWRKRKKNGPQKTEQLEELRQIIDANVSCEAVNTAWKRVSDAITHGGRGWLDMFKLYLDRRYGKPAQYVSADLSTSGDHFLTIEYVKDWRKDPVTVSSSGTEDD